MQQEKEKELLEAVLVDSPFEKKNLRNLLDNFSEVEAISVIKTIAEEIINEINKPTNHAKKIEHIIVFVEILIRLREALNYLYNYKIYRNSKSHN